MDKAQCCLAQFIEQAPMTESTTHIPFSLPHHIQSLLIVLYDKGKNTQKEKKRLRPKL